MNEYLKEVKALKSLDTFRGQQWFGRRKELVEKYSWAIPHTKVLDYLANFEHIIEVGAGSGYWAKCIEDHGGNVMATDVDPPETVYTDVAKQNLLNVEIKDSTILTVWPPYDERAFMQIPKRGASHILYVGEPRGGCTGHEEFFDLLERDYGLVKQIDIPSFVGVNDNFYHYVRKV